MRIIKDFISSQWAALIETFLDDINFIQFSSQAHQLEKAIDVGCCIVLLSMYLSMCGKVLALYSHASYNHTWTKVIKSLWLDIHCYSDAAVVFSIYSFWCYTPYYKLLCVTRQYCDAIKTFLSHTLYLSQYFKTEKRCKQ